MFPNLVISSIGPHARKNVESIIDEKREAIDRHGFTYWLYHSIRARPDGIQNFARACLENALEPTCVFVKGAREGTVSTPAIRNQMASFVTHDKRIPPTKIAGHLVTGKLPAFGLVLGSLETCDENLGMNEFGLFSDPGEPAKFSIAAATLACRRIETKFSATASSHKKVIAYSVLKHPYAVWLSQ